MNAASGDKLPPSVPDNVALSGQNDLAKQLQDRAVRWILEGTEWLTESEVASRAGTGVSTIERWRADHKIFAIDHAGRDLYPRYGFDEQMHPLRVISEVLFILEDFSSWSVAAWFESPSSFLGGRRPRELAAIAPEEVKAAAADSVVQQRYVG